jgi:hypothetical protein
MTALRIGVVLLVLLGLAGCAGYAPKESAFRATALPTPSSTEAIVYVYRTDRIEGYASQRVVSLSDAQSVSLDHQCFTWFVTKPGPQVISSDIPWSKRDLFKEYKPTTTTLDVQPGKTYFVHLAIGVFPRGRRTGMSIVGAGGPVMYSEPIVQYTEDLVVEDEATAAKRISEYRLQRAVRR